MNRFYDQMRSLNTSVDGYSAIAKWVKIGKTVIVASLSWEIAQICGAKFPFFAPLAAVLCLQGTVQKSISKGVQRVLGIIVGVILASVLSTFIGANWWSIGLIILISLLVGRAFKFPEEAINQINASALLVLVIGTKSDHYGIDRTVQTLIGAAVAIIINMLIAPPDYTNQAAVSFKKAVELLISALQPPLRVD